MKKQAASHLRSMLILSLLAVGFLMAAGPLMATEWGGATDAAKEAALAAERAQVESVSAALREAKRTLDQEIRLLTEQRFTLERDLAAQDREYRRIRGEQQALKLEVSGEVTEAAFKRQEAALHNEASRLKAQREALELERQRLVASTQAEQKEIEARRAALRDGRQRFDGGGVDDEMNALALHYYELNDRIEDADYDVRMQQHELRVQLATFYNANDERKRQEARRAGDTERERVWAARQERSLRQRTAIDAKATFEAADAALNRALRAPRRTLHEVPKDDPAYEQAKVAFDRLRDSRQSLKFIRQVEQEETRRLRLEDQIKAHLEKLEGARTTASATAVAELEEEIARLRNALARLAIVRRGEGES